MNQFILSILFVAAMCMFQGCAKEAACEFDACAVKAPASEIQQIQEYLAANNIQAVQHCSGVFYRILQEGTGANPTPCSTVDVTYEGRLTNGNKFDESTTTITFSLQQLIRSWQVGIPLVKSGGKIQLIVPPSLGYGDRPVGNIPANSILIFDIGLFGVR